MLHFEEDWFRDEEREGFLVTEEVKRGWAAQLVIVKEIEEVCKKYGLQYFTAWGTTLGAVRHHGFIPWDDDLDICMKRGDYMKFLSVWRKEFPAAAGTVSMPNFSAPYWKPRPPVNMP